LYSYVEFTVVIRRGTETKHGHRVTVECVMPHGGQIGATDAQPLISTVSSFIPAETAEQRIELGNVLGSCLMPGKILTAFHETVQALGPDTGVRVRLDCPDAEMARWPWELARVPVQPRRRPQYLFRNEHLSLVRHVLSERPVDQPKERRKLVILTVDATRVKPRAQLVPDFPEELPRTGLLERKNLPHPTRTRIEQATGQIAGGQDPIDIFHFTGHGEAPGTGKPGALVLYRHEDTGAELYPGDELAERLAFAGTSLAFVNACYGDDQATGSGPGVAQSLADVVPVVVAMRGAVGDRVAGYFADEFYRWLLEGSTVDEAVTRGRLALDESLSDWGRVVLYSRARSGRFLEPARSAEMAPALVPPVHQATDGIRRWAMAAGAGGHWQFIPGEAGPELRQVGAGAAVDISHIQTVGASLALSCDARVAAQLSRGQLFLAWVDRVSARLDRWPESFVLPLGGEEARLLAVAVDYGDEVICLLSTDRATYRVEVSPGTEPAVSEYLGAPTRAATILAGHTYTVDEEGQLRGRQMNQQMNGIAQVTSLDAARSAGRAVWAVAGEAYDGRPVVADNRSGAMTAWPGTAADEVAVIRTLSGRDAPDQVVLAVNGHIERMPAGGAS
jgi:hypothetical protein